MSQLGLFVWNKPACSRVHLYMFPSLKDIKGCTRIQNKLCSVTWICKRLTFTSFDGTELFMPYFQALPSVWKTVVSHLKWCLLLGDCCNKFLLSTSYWICFQLYILNYVLVKITTCAQLPNYKNYFPPGIWNHFNGFVHCGYSLVRHQKQEHGISTASNIIIWRRPYWRYSRTYWVTWSTLNRQITN